MKFEEIRLPWKNHQILCCSLLIRVGISVNILKTSLRNGNFWALSACFTLDPTVIVRIFAIFRRNSRFWARNWFISLNFLIQFSFSGILNLKFWLIHSKFIRFKKNSRIGSCSLLLVENLAQNLLISVRLRHFWSKFAGFHPNFL